MKRFRAAVNYKESRSFDSELYYEISRIHDIPRRASKWTSETCKALRIKYVNTSKVEDIIAPCDIDLSDEVLLPGWNENNFSNIDNTAIRYKGNGTMRATNISTIIHKVMKIVKSQNLMESNVNSFMMSLLVYLKCDNYPFIV